MNKLITLLTVTIILSLSSCMNRSGGKEDAAYAHQRAEVEEVLQTSSYTYLLVEQKDEEIWIAINKQDIHEGDIIYFEGGLEMTNFESAELNRTFESVLFVDVISDQPIMRNMPGDMGMAHGMNQPQKPVLEKLEIRISQPEGGTAIGTLYNEKSNYAGKKVTVRGQVTKVNDGIMGRNWVHIQDGSSFGDYFDLTVTTQHLPVIGDTLTYSGTLNVDRDFGAGYVYDLILEDAEALDAEPVTY